mmetsp:Transcript_77155/g.89778  ORF Transcript_77155/g.89778 Transcript_77155/m.89778 type:complete len:84 (+) Transcript_77155:641-892(+)
MNSEERKLSFYVSTMEKIKESQQLLLTQLNLYFVFADGYEITYLSIMSLMSESGFSICTSLHFNILHFLFPHFSSHKFMVHHK